MAMAMALALAMALVGCDDYDTFTTDTSYRLMLSVDTIRFDTLITTIPSSTKTLTLRNPHDEGLRISQVRLDKGAQSLFRVNVDGWDLSKTSDGSATDFEVRRRDSIVVRVEVTMQEVGSDAYATYDDALSFTLESGVVQRVPIIVTGRDAYLLHGPVVGRDTTFANNRPIVIYDSLYVGRGATLTLSAGTTLMFHEGAGLIVDGRVVARGTLDAPVVMRGDRTDHMFSYLPYDKLPGRWEGIVIRGESHDNEMEYLDLHGANYGIRCDSSLTGQTKLTLYNSRITQINGDGLALTASHVVVVNSEVSNTYGHCVNILGGTNEFVHCTLAQYYPLGSVGYALQMTNYVDSIDYILRYPLQAAYFYNCLFTGYADDEMMGQWYEAEDEEDAIPVSYRFWNCFLTTGDSESDPEDPDPTFRGNRYENEEDSICHQQHFVLFDTHTYDYDFTPVEHSAIRNCADPQWAKSFPLDRLGRSRLADEAPDPGCYEAPQP